MSNILFITKEIPFPPVNGHRKRTLSFLKELSKWGDITLVCFGKENVEKRGIEKYCKDIKLVYKEDVVRKSKLFFSALIGLFSKIPFSVRRRFSLNMREEIKKLTKNRNIDLIFCDSIFCVVNLPKNNHNCKIVLGEHNVESMIIERYRKVEKNIFKKIYAFIEEIKMKIFEKKWWRKVDKCIVVSDIDKKIVEKRIQEKSKIEVIPNGVDTEYFSPSNSISTIPYSLIYVGQMSWYPNQDAVIYFLEEIYPLIKKRESRVSFWIIGRGISEKIKRFSQQDNSIKVIGYVEDIRPYIAQSEIFVVPLRIGSGTRLKILEAMAMGKPVISTSIGCEGLEVENGKNIIICDTSQDFAEAILKLFKNKSFSKRVEEAGRKLVKEKYSWRKILKDLHSKLI